MRTNHQDNEKKAAGRTQAVPALPGLSVRLSWHGRAGQVQLSAKLSIITAHSLWHSWDMTPCAMQWRPSKFVLHMPLQRWQIQQHALAHTDMGSIQSTRAEIRGSPHLLLRHIDLSSLPSPWHCQKYKNLSLMFSKCVCFTGLSPPPFFFWGQLKIKVYQKDNKEKKKSVWYHWIQPVRISHIKELCPWALSNRLSENFIFLLPWLDSLFE